MIFFIISPIRNRHSSMSISIKGNGKMTQLALRYLNFAHSNEKIHAKYQVELKESQILRMVAKAYLENVPIEFRI